MIYVLSIGPAFVLNKRGILPVKALEILYTPLVTVTQIIPGGDWLMERYIRLWGVEGVGTV
jgi:hypothetical protein